MLNYYQILNISPDSNQEQIKKAYRTAALFWHPDKNSNPNASQNFIDITEAYKILSNPEKRSVYDKLLYEEKERSFNNTENGSNFSENSFNKSRYEAWVNEARASAKNNIKVPIDNVLTDSFHFIDKYGFLLLVIIGIIFYLVIFK